MIPFPSISGRSEAYIDQSRGISVNIGSADIRTSMLKQRMFLSKTYVFMQEEQQGYKVFVEQASHEMNKGAFDRALGYLNKAIRVRVLFIFGCRPLAAAQPLK